MHAQSRERRVEKLLAERDRELVVHDETLVVVPPGTVAPTDKDHFAVFTPYHRRWADHPRRPLLDPPRRLASPRVRLERIPLPRRCVPATALGTCPLAARRQDAAGCRPGCGRR